MLVASLTVMGACASSNATEETETEPAFEYDVDAEKAIDRLSNAVTFPTISLEDTTAIDYDIYDEFLAFLEDQFPAVHDKFSSKRIGQYSKLYTWEGSNPELKPMLLMGHYDVVPVTFNADSVWQYEPFRGAKEEGYVWGRGTLDDKSGIMSIMEGAEYLAEQGFQPERTVMIALHHDEEVGGQRGAGRIAEYLKKEEIELEYIVDEGLPIAEEILDRVDKPLAMIGVADKGSVNIELTYQREGGHSSMPPRTSVIGTLSNAVNRIERKPMKGHYKGLITKTFEPLIPYMSYTQRLAFNNTWLFRPFIKRKLSQNAATNAALRTTAAKTVFEAGFKENVLPVTGRVIINFRVHPNNTIEEVEEYVRDRIRNDDIHVRVMDRARQPSPVSDTGSEPYQMLQETIKEAFPEVLVAPSLFVAASDARHFLDLSDNIYRFRPIRATHEDRTRVHGIDERISVENYLEMVQFQTRLIENGSREL